MTDAAPREALLPRVFLAAALSGLLINTSAASPSARDGEGRIAAVVEQLIGNNEDIRVRSSVDETKDPDQQLALFQQLRTGDHIIVKSPGGVVILSLVGSGERRTIMQGDSPFEVPAPGTAPTLWRNLGHELIKASMKSISSLWLEKRPKTESAIAAISRGGETGGELRAPVFQFGAQRVVAGERTFTLAWEGGEPPYTVDIKREGNAQPLARVDGLSSPEVPPTDVRLQPGRHSIIIRDRDNAHTVRLAFDAVEASREPSPGNPSPFSGLPGEVGTTLSAVWLAAQEGGAWSLESVQRVDGLARNGYQPAILLRDRLLFDGEAVTLPAITQ